MDEADDSNGMQNLETEILQPIRNLLLESLNHESQAKIKEIIKEVQHLSKLERLMLYMELPASQPTSDPLRQPNNPLGSRSQIQLAITWIKTHLEEDPQVSLPKHEVYDEYMEHCTENSSKALSTADFGKVMKQVYPHVRPRRLGTRGNSRYCYAGLRKRIKLEEPCTPDWTVENSDMSRASRVEEAATFLLLEWVEKVFKERIESVKDLGLFLIDKMYVDNQSSAAHTLLSSIKMQGSHDVLKSEPVERKDRPFQFDGFKPEKKKKLAVKPILDAPPPQLPLEHELNLCNTKRKRLGSLSQQQTEKDYINDGHLKSQGQMTVDGASQEQQDWGVERLEIEDEITSYFGDTMETDDTAKNDKLSQLRQLLEKNLKQPVSVASSSSMSGGARAFREDTDSKQLLMDDSWANFGGESAGAAATAVASSSTLSQRRRVSFNSLVVQEPTASSGPGAIQPSPGRKRHFSFQPISPRQNSSLPQSPTNANSSSPFISPRSTPVPPPMLRSRNSSGNLQQLLPLQLLPQQKNPFGSSSSDNSRAATFGSISECGTPFISPHGTPVPFNRSRHSSAQGILCSRSRHSSGLGGPAFRYNMTFSPMALSNLNNPYSPQPSTPLAANQEELALLQQQQRSRHSSAESEPAMRTAGMLMSPPGGYGTMQQQQQSGVATLLEERRQRHASAGPATYLGGGSSESTSWCLVGDSDMKQAPKGNNDDEGQDFHQQMMDVSTAGAFHDTDQLFKTTNKEEERKDIPDDLDIALSVLQGDNDFSKFVEDSENARKFNLP